MIGRKNESKLLADLCSRANTGELGFAFVCGEAGAGKSRLIEDVVSRCDLRVFRGRAACDASTPYQPIIQVLRGALQSGNREFTRIGRLSKELRRLLPELGVPSKAAFDREQFAEALGSAMGRLARTYPCCFWLEDLQWCDHATLDLLPFLVDRLRENPLIFIVSYRTEEIGSTHPIRRLRSELRRRKGILDLHLKPLSRAEVGELATQLLGRKPSPALLDMILAKTQGLPLFLEEICGILRKQGNLKQGPNGLLLPTDFQMPIPESIGDLMLLRVAHLTANGRQIAEAGAVAGQRFDGHLVSRLAGEAEGLDELVDSQILLEQENGQFVFRHSLMRETILGEITWSKKRCLHLDLAQLLETGRSDPEWIGRHYLAAGRTDAALPAFVRAAENACRMHAYRDSARIAKEALAIWPPGKEEPRRLEVLKQFARCAQLGGETSDAILAWREILETVEENPEERGLAYRGLATAYTMQGASGQALKAREAAAACFIEENMPEKAVRELIDCSGLHVTRFRYAAAEETARQAVALAEQSAGRELLSLALGQLAMIEAMSGRIESARQNAEQALSLALSANTPELIAAAYRNLAYVHEYSSEFASACSAFQTALDLCRREDITHTVESCRGCLAYAFYRRGEWKETQTICRGILSDPESSEIPRLVAGGVLGLLQAWRGEIKQARRNLLESERLIRKTGLIVMQFYIQSGLGLLAELEGKPEEAQRCYEDILGLWQENEDRYDVVPPIFHAAVYFGRTGLKGPVNRCAEILSSISAASANPEVLGVLAFVLGETAMLDQDSALAGKHFQQALAQSEKLGLTLECSVCGLRAGEALLADGKKKEGMELLGRAYRVSRNLGARRIASQIATVMGDWGEPAEEPRRPTAQSRVECGGLTRREQEVAEYIGQGLTNKEIARKLFVSPRTIDMHVGNILNRLDCRTRSEAVQKLSRLGLFGRSTS